MGRQWRMYFVIKKHFAAVMSRTTTPLTAIEPSLTEHEFLQPVQTQKTLVLIQQESFSTHNLTIEPINNSVTAYLVRVYISPTWTCSPLPRDKATKTLKTEKKLGHRAVTTELLQRNALRSQQAFTPPYTITPLIVLLSQLICSRNKTCIRSTNIIVRKETTS